MFDYQRLDSHLVKLNLLNHILMSFNSFDMFKTIPIVGKISFDHYLKLLRVSLNFNQ